MSNINVDNDMADITDAQIEAFRATAQGQALALLCDAALRRLSPQAAAAELRRLGCVRGTYLRGAGRARTGWWRVYACSREWLGGGVVVAARCLVAEAIEQSS